MHTLTDAVIHRLHAARRQFTGFLTAAVLVAPLLPGAALAESDRDRGDTAVVNAIQSFLYQQSQSLGEEIRIEVFQPSASFGECENPAPFLPHGDGEPQLGRVSVGVRCGGESRSARYLSAEVSVIGEYLELAAPVPRGTVIDEGMLRTVRGNLARLPAHAILDKESAVGQAARRHLSEGNVLREQDLQAIAVIERGEEVTIESAGRGFRVTRQGEALEPGAMGETIRVRLSRRENLTATVSGQGRVSVD